MQRNPIESAWQIASGKQTDPRPFPPVADSNYPEKGRVELLLYHFLQGCIEPWLALRDEESANKIKEIKLPFTREHLVFLGGLTRDIKHESDNPMYIAMSNFTSAIATFLHANGRLQDAADCIGYAILANPMLFEKFAEIVAKVNQMTVGQPAV